MEKDTQIKTNESVRKNAYLVLKSLVFQALQKGDGFALWRLPLQNKLFFISDQKPKTGIGNFVDLSTAKGFLFAPFESASTTYFLQGEHPLAFELVTSTQNQNEHKWELEAQFPIEGFSDQHQAQNIPVKSFYSSNNPDLADTNEEHFIEMVKLAIEKINQNQIEKLVPSRKYTEKAENELDLIDVYIKAALAYPRAMVSLVSIPEAGTWLGASPEILVSQNNQGIFKTVALAGTQVNVGKSLKEVSWTQKEIEEQALVSRYIINCFKKIRLREFDELGPKTVVSGNLLHLKTEFLVDTIKERYPQLPQVMLELLHPTSAVCGMPKNSAVPAVLEMETHNREFFTGYLGPVGLESETHLYVNLRCIQVKNGYIIFYAGAGVTEDSIPEKEWDETWSKIKTIRDLIFQN